MNVAHLARAAIWVAVGSLCLLASFGSGAALTACGEDKSCTKLRNDTYAAKEMWDACDPLDVEPCAIIPGNPKDCTGVLACAFAVNPHYRAQAEQAVYSIGERSQGCYLCAVPNCIMGDIAWCEPATNRCIVVTALDDAGAVIFVAPPADSGSPEASTTTLPDAGAAE